MTKIKTIDVCAGAFIVLIGVLAIVESLSFEIGTTRRIGPGYFPFYVGLFMVVLGVVIALERLWTKSLADTEFSFPPLRAPLLIMAAVVTFAVMVERFGLIPAVGVGVFLASLADTNTTLMQKLTVSVAVPLVATLIFKIGLDMHVDVIRWRP
ncbi:tripartite tricarboxylate transporter TctB family protein [Pararhodobacter zhoushanensis]|uniref:tripartite tricarboxylate transporter TctB family protein n=1 Tax=Pararhodobacter zhoushanensis TaxID=2479545 RepID=UPI0013DF3A54|nr:tripartite tricarboxylate transporter TctB family protein [Pararhodobacter zhoushanensis]